MNKILRKRILRDLRSNLLRYLALFALIVFGMFLIVSIVGGAEDIVYTVHSGEERNHVEDGNFSTFVPLKSDEIKHIEDQGVSLEKMFYLDYLCEDGSTIRISQNRSNINQIDLTEGQKAENANEILLEKHYAAAHGLTVGETIKIGGIIFKITGIGTTPDYDLVLKDLTDSSGDGKQFGTAFVTEKQYEQLRDEQKAVKSEEYNYAYHLNGALTSKELKDLISELEFSEEQVEDKFFREMVDERRSDQYDMEDGIRELKDGAKELKDGLSELNNNNVDLNDGIAEIYESYLENAGEELKSLGREETLTEDNYEQVIRDIMEDEGLLAEQLTEALDGLDGVKEFKDAVTAYTDGVSAIRDGAESLDEGAGTLKNGVTELSGSSDDLVKGAAQVFEANLNDTSAALSAYGVSLTEDNYQTVLSELIKSAGTMGDEALSGQLQAALEGLNNLKAYKEGVQVYAAGVDGVAGGAETLKNGARTLADGAGELTGYNEGLQSGAAQIFDAMLGQVSDELAESGIEETLTEENYQTVLVNLIGSEGDTIVKEQLETALDGLSGLKKYKDGIKEYTDGVAEAAKGAEEFYDGIAKMQEKTDDLIDEYFTVDLDNLTSFMKKEDNPRIEASINDVLINKYVGMAAGVIVMILFTFVISVFVIHGIEKELSVIGALYALGAKRKQLIRHYLMLPVLITLIGGIVGTAIGLHPAAFGLFNGESVDYFSMPEISRVYPAYLFIYGVIMPPLVAVFVNYLVINKRLSQPALRLLRGEQQEGGASRLKLKSFGYVRKFQIRQFLREIRSGFAVVFGMFISLLILMLGVNCYALCNNMMAGNKRDTTFEYMYTLKYPEKEIPKVGEACYMESLTKTAYGYDLEVTLMGIDDDNPYFSFERGGGKNKVTVSDAAASKFQIKAGDMLVLKDEITEQNYAFEVENIVPYSVGMYVFMDIDSMRELFGQEDDYYNVILSGEELNIEAGRLYGVITRKMIGSSAEIFLEMMQTMIVMMTGVAIVIFIIVMYLMMKVMIDRSAYHISLMKVFGYRRREIKKLYLDGNFYLVAAAALICIPLSKIMMDLMYPYFISNVAVGMDLTLGWQTYAVIYVGILICYVVINQMLMGMLGRVMPAEILKNRE